MQAKVSVKKENSFEEIMFLSIRNQHVIFLGVQLCSHRCVFKLKNVESNKGRNMLTAGELRTKWGFSYIPCDTRGQHRNVSQAIFMYRNTTEIAKKMVLNFYSGTHDLTIPAKAQLC